MQVDVQVIPIAERLREGLPAEVLLRRGPDSVGESWWILERPLASELSWAVNKKSDTIRVPMFPYDIPKQSESELPLFGAQIASAFLLAAERGPPGSRIQKSFVVLSEVFPRRGLPGYQIYAGAAFLTGGNHA